MENLTRKAQLQEIELERSGKQLKEAIAIAGEETAKCKAAKEVIKSLTAQVSCFSFYVKKLRMLMMKYMPVFGISFPAQIVSVLTS